MNTKSTQNSFNKDLDAFFKYLNGGISTIGTGKDSDSAFVRMLDEYVVGINGSEDWRQGFMKYELNLIESKNKGFEEGEVHGIKIGEARGISIGETRGEANATSRIVKTMYSDGLSTEKISQYASIPVEKVQSILQG